MTGSAMREEGQCSSLENLVLDPELPCTTLTYLGNHPAPHFLQLEIKAIKLDEIPSLPINNACSDSGHKFELSSITQVQSEQQAKFQQRRKKSFTIMGWIYIDNIRLW